MDTEELAETSQELVELRNDNAALQSNVEFLAENMADLVLRLDDMAWLPLGDSTDVHAFPLQAVKQVAVTARSLAVINPLIKRAIALRCAYIWGNGVEFEGMDEKSSFFKNSANQKYLFSQKAQVEMEKTLATDGNFFLMIKKGKGRRSDATFQRISMREITGVIFNPDNAEEIWFYRREWSTITSSKTSEMDELELNRVYYPAVDYDDKMNGHPSVYRGIPIDWTARIAHKEVEGQVGWHWGVPDLMSAMFWAKAHKEFLENQAALVKAYARFAFKVTAPSKPGVQAAAAKVGTPPAIDQWTGQPNDVGGTAVLGQGATLSSVGRTGGSVDFKAGTPLAGYIAAGMNVPLSELLADASEANRSSSETLSSATLKVMKARQQEHVLFLNSIFNYLGMDVTVKFPDIEKELVYRTVQAIAQAATLNMLSAEEVRAMLLDAFEIETDAGVPTEKQLGNLILAMSMAAEAQDQAKAANAQYANQSGAPSSGSAGGKPDYANKSNGDNGYRNDAGQHAYSNGKNG